MTEELVTLEAAKLLKEKGFVWKCEHIIDRNKVITKSDLPQSMSCCTEIDDEPVEFLCPTLYIAQKWLRENHSIHIAVYFNQYGRWYYRLYDIKDYDFLFGTEVDKTYKSYEEALEAGIQETLKLI